MTDERYSYINYTPDGVATDFTFEFGYLAPEHVHAYLDDVEVPIAEFVTAKTIRIDPAPVGTILQIRRFTPPLKPVVQFTSASMRDPVVHNLQTLQLLYLVQEALDRALDALHKGLNDHFSAQDRRIEKGLPAEAGDHFVTFAQAQQMLLGGGGIINITFPHVIPFTGDGVTTEIDLDPVEGVTAGNCFVHINGLVKRTSEYAMNGAGSVLILNEPPALGDKGEVRIFTGQIVGGIADGSIENRHLADRTIQAVKLVLATLTNAEIAPGAIQTDKLVNNAVTADKLAPASVDPTNDIIGLVPHAKIAAGLPTTTARRTVGSGTSYWWGKPALQNGVKPRFVAISLDRTNIGDAGKHFQLEISADNETFIPVGKVRLPDGSQDTDQLGGWVPPAYYYRLVKTSGGDGNTAVLEWVETDLGF